MPAHRPDTVVSAIADRIAQRSILFLSCTAHRRDCASAARIVGFGHKRAAAAKSPDVRFALKARLPAHRPDAVVALVAGGIT